MDANELNVQLDQKIAGMIKESGKGLILVVSKWDTVEDKDAYTRDAMAPEIADTYDFVPWAPLIFTSTVTGQNVTKIFDLALDIDKRRGQRILTRELNRWLRQMVDKHPPAGLKNRAPKLNYMVQEDDNPMPAFKIFGVTHQIPALELQTLPGTQSPREATASKAPPSNFGSSKSTRPTNTATARLKNLARTTATATHSATRARLREQGVRLLACSAGEMPD